MIPFRGGHAIAEATLQRPLTSIVMPGLVPDIHARSKTWMAGTSPAMTMTRVIVLTVA
jgi:hypothetical protein